MRNYQLFGKFAVAVICLCVIQAAVAGSSYPTSECVKETHCCPGVDSRGCLWYKKSSNVCFKVTYDYCKKECYACGTGKVCNSSCRSQCYKDICLLKDYSNSCRTVDWQSDKYEVAKDGCCKAEACGTCCYKYPQPPAPTPAKTKSKGGVISKIKSKIASKLGLS